MPNSGPASLKHPSEMLTRADKKCNISMMYYSSSHTLAHNAVAGLLSGQKQNGCCARWPQQQPAVSVSPARPNIHILENPRTCPGCPLTYGQFLLLLSPIAPENHLWGIKANIQLQYVQTGRPKKDPSHPSRLGHHICSSTYQYSTSSSTTHALHDHILLW